MNWFNIFIHLGEDYPEYTINLCQIAAVDRTDHESWDVTLANGDVYILAGHNLARFRQAAGL